MTDDYPTFEKLQIAEQRDIPITAVVRTGEDEKRDFKFIRTDRRTTGPEEVEPYLYHLPDIEPPADLLAVAAQGIETHTKYTVHTNSE